MEKYYIALPEYIDQIYPWGDIVCISMREVKRLAMEWEMSTADLLEEMEEASAEQIAKYGTYD